MKFQDIAVRGITGLACTPTSHNTCLQISYKKTLGHL